MTSRWFVFLSVVCARGYDKVRQEPIAKAVHGIAAQCSTEEGHMNCTNHSVEALSNCGPEDLTCQCAQVRHIKDYCDEVCGAPAHTHQATTMFLENSCSHITRSADFPSKLVPELTMHQLVDLEGRPRMALKAMEDKLRIATETIRQGMSQSAEEEEVEDGEDTESSDANEDSEVDTPQKRDYVVYHVDSNSPQDRERLKDKAAQAAMLLQAEFDVKGSTLVEEVQNEGDPEPETMEEPSKAQKDGHAYIFNVAHATVGAQPTPAKQIRPSTPITPQQDGRLNRAKHYLRAKINQVAPNNTIAGQASQPSNYTRDDSQSPKSNSPSRIAFDVSRGSSTSLALPLVVVAVMALAL